MSKNQKGFTLIELLVVIAIIGLLSTLSVLALNTARARARDAKRVADVKQIQTALEMYYNDVGSYPATASVAAGAAISTTNGVYLSVVPTPPTPFDFTTGNCVGQPEYTYTADGLAPYSTYHINYCLGAQTGGVSSGLKTATPAGIQ
ncbi:MAG: prepilin-type N-terminal cleavage/methylation domain-containing protein [Patescibacteria group bacterium]